MNRRPSPLFNLGPVSREELNTPLSLELTGRKPIPYDERKSFEKLYELFTSGQFKSVDVGDTETRRRFDEYARIRESEDAM